MEDKDRKIMTVLILAYEDMAKYLINVTLNLYGVERCRRYLAAFNTHLDGTKENIANYAKKRIDEEI